MTLKKGMIKWSIGVLMGIVAAVMLLFHSYPRIYKEIVYQYAEEYDLDPLLVYSVMKVESKFNTNAISYRGAKGLLQIMDHTGEWGSQQIQMKEYVNEQLFYPETNIRIGCWYLSKLMKQYNGDITKVLAAYNAGSGNVAKWMKNSTCSYDGKELSYIPFKETRNYIKKVNFHRKVYELIYRN